MRDEAYEQLAQAIVAGVLGPGEVLRDQAIAAWLGTSRTPVREALSRLADDGLVEMAANRFTRVAPLSADAAADAHRLLALLEGELAAERAAGLRGDEDDGAAMADELARLADEFGWALWRADADETLAADRAFHGVLQHVAGRPHLRAAVHRLEPVARRAQRATWASIATSWPMDCHPQLVDALRAGDGEAARRALSAEWRQLADVVARALSAG